MSSNHQLLCVLSSSHLIKSPVPYPKVLLWSTTPTYFPLYFPSLELDRIGSSSPPCHTTSPDSPNFCLLSPWCARRRCIFRKFCGSCFLVGKLSFFSSFSSPSVLLSSYPCSFSSSSSSCIPQFIPSIREKWGLKKGGNVKNERCITHRTEPYFVAALSLPQPLYPLAGWK